MAQRDGKPLLGRDDWTAAALQALADGGPAGIAVDRLAKQLGVTRGSFYWHFADRNELITATLERWERENTTDQVGEAFAVADPVERLRLIIRRVYQGRTDPVELALAARAGDPVVAGAVARVTETRLDLLRSVFRDLGFTPAVARDRAWLAYGFYVGHHQLGQNEAIRQRRPPRLDYLVTLLTA
ncbi:TetR/AcrR family transcriptional regulator [Microlunatus sp. GCM10028923]|uniref:TetR/AcrR family transcriptional regulator n=1 Tax=Microlunatus sp. GCM10028923 TaxID=3273400 RepID=UPI0036147440